MVAVLAVHMLLIKRHRMAPLPWGTPAQIAEREGSEPSRTFTSHLRHIGLWSLVLFGIVLLAAGLLPAGLGPAGVEGIEITKPPWYFLTIIGGVLLLLGAVGLWRGRRPAVRS